MRCDVAVVGGGPAGCTAALALRAHAPALSVVLVDAGGGGDEQRVGETLPPPAAPVLRHLGVWDAFRAAGHREAYASAAAWGAAVPHESEFVYHVRQVGWQLDRAAFDGMLLDAAASAGARVLPGTRVGDAARAEGGWALDVDGRHAGAVRARFVVDATGQGARFARRHGGARARSVDRLAGFVRFFRRAGGPPGTLVEAVEDGWWYTAPLPGGARVAALLTDTDLARASRVDAADGWEAALRRTRHVAAALAGADGGGDVVARAARSRRLDGAYGDGWIAAGDAAQSWDPLSSQGILKALRSGVFAAYAAADLLARGDAGGMERYRRFQGSEWEGYLAARARHYAAERRWPESEFWRRRHAAAVRAVPAPERVLA